MVIGSKASIYKVTSLPPTGNPDSIYFLKLPNEEIAEIYITDINGAFTPSGNKQFVQEVFDSMSSYLVKTDDERLINAREWLADVVSKSDAELGISSERFVWTALRDRQATEYHFNDVSSGFGRLLLKSATAASVRNELQLGNTVTHNYGSTSGTVMQGDDSRVLNAVGRGELDSRLNSKVDKEVGKSLTDENFTLSEKQKLASLESSRWRGLFVSIAALPATATAGDYADVDSGASADIQRFIWDNSDSKWVAQSGVVPPITGAQVKALYEAQPDTNAFTDAEKSKLSGVALNATKNATDAQLRDRATHTGFQPISTITNLQSGLDSKVDKVTGKELSTNDFTTVLKTKLENMDSGTGIELGEHIGSGGTSHALATTTVAGFMSGADKTKLNSVATGATANATNAQLRDRSMHTGTQAVSTITGLGTAATKNVGTAGDNVMQVGAFGVGSRALNTNSDPREVLKTSGGFKTYYDGGSPVNAAVTTSSNFFTLGFLDNPNYYGSLFQVTRDHNRVFMGGVSAGNNRPWVEFHHTGNQLPIGTTPASARAALQIPDSIALKTFIGTAVSNASGEFTINWSSAGFTASPQHVTVTAYNTDGVVTNRVWATMKAKALQTATQGQGYTLKGNNLVGGYSNLSVPNQTNNAGVVAAPSITVTVMAWGN